MVDPRSGVLKTNTPILLRRPFDRGQRQEFLFRDSCLGEVALALNAETPNAAKTLTESISNGSRVDDEEQIRQVATD